MERDARTQARIEEHWAASESGDIGTEHAIYADDGPGPTLEPAYRSP